MRHPPQRQDCVQLWHGLDLGLQEGAAGIHLGGDGLVLGGQAADNIGDTRAMQADIVIANHALVTGGSGLVGKAIQEVIAAIMPNGTMAKKAKPAKHVEKIAASGIAGKRTTRAICSAPTRRKADHQKPCVQRSVSLDRRIVPVRFGRTAFPPQ